MENTLLLEYDYFPGWTMGDYTSWNTKVTLDGFMRQHIDPSEGKTKRKHGAIIHERELTVQEFSTLERLLSKFPTNYSESFKNIGVCIDDAENIYLNSPEYGLKISGPLLSLEHMRKRNEFVYDLDLSPAIRLWIAIDAMQVTKST